MSDCAKPSPRLRAAASRLYEIGTRYGWWAAAAPSSPRTYAELEQNDPIGFEEFNQVVDDVLGAADEAIT